MNWATSTSLICQVFVLWVAAVFVSTATSQSWSDFVRLASVSMLLSPGDQLVAYVDGPETERDVEPPVLTDKVKLEGRLKVTRCVIGWWDADTCLHDNVKLVKMLVL